jgi:hypothetical protein
LKRIISGLVAAGYLVLGFAAMGVGGAILMAAFVVFPLACIWFGKELGDYTGSMSLQYINAKSPARLVELAGWVILLLAPAVFLVTRMLGGR